MSGNVHTYMLLAEECFRDARHLLQNEGYRSAAGRAYYAYFDAVRALLATKNVSSKSHSAIKMLFGEHFVQTGIFERVDAKNFHKLFLLRQNSDCDSDEEVTEVDATDAVETASEFILQVEAYLRQTNFVS